MFNLQAAVGDFSHLNCPEYAEEFGPINFCSVRIMKAPTTTF